MTRSIRFLLLLLPICALAQIPEVKGTPVDGPALRYIDDETGTGAIAAPGKKFKLHYTGWLRNGAKFDSSVDRNEPFEFVQGRRQVIAGFDVGFEGMKAGGKRRILIPYQLAYGEAGSGTAIPPKSDLIFDVELLAVTDVPPLVPANDLLLPQAVFESKLIALAKAVPEEKYSWRPAPNVRSFGEVFLHIAYGQRLLLDLADNIPTPEAFKKRVAEQIANEKKPAAKEEILKALAESFAAVKKALEAERMGTLAKETEFFGRPTTRRGVLVALDTHTAEHMGQLIAYARMNGITPPWSE